MAYVIKIELVKPANLLWFFQSSPDAPATVAAINAWTAAHPGFQVSVDHTEGNVYTILYVFDTAVNGQAWLDQKKLQPDWIIRDDYYTSIGVVSDTVIFS